MIDISKKNDKILTKIKMNHMKGDFNYGNEY